MQMETLHRTIFILIIISFVLIILCYSLLKKSFKNGVNTKAILSTIYIPVGSMKSSYDTTTKIIQPKNSILKDVKFMVVTPPVFSGEHVTSNRIGTLKNNGDILESSTLENTSNYVNEYSVDLNNGTIDGIYLKKRPAFNFEREIFPQILFENSGVDAITSYGEYLVEIEYEEVNIQKLPNCHVQ